MYKFVYCGALPIMWATWFLFLFLGEFVLEGRLHPRLIRRTVEVALTIFPALRGNMAPFYAMLARVD